MSPRGRGIVSRVLVVLAAITTVLAIAAGYARHVAVNSDQFANRATAALRSDSVRSLIAEKITDEVVLRQEADLTAARPLIETIAEQVVGTRAFAKLFRSSVRDLHRALFDRDQHTLTLTVTDIGTVLAAGLQVVRPALARQVEKIDRVDVLQRDVGSASAGVVRVAHTVRLVAALLAAVALLLAAAALVVAPDTRSAIVDLGIGAAAGGVVLAVVCTAGRSVVVGRLTDPDTRAAAGAVWDTFLADLRTESWLYAASGVVVAASAASLIRPVDLQEPIVRAARWIATEPARPAWRVARGIVLVVAGVLVLTQRDAVLALLFTLAGIYLVFAGVSAILRLVYQAPADSRAPTMRTAVREREHRRVLAIPVLAVGVIVAAILILVGSGATTTPAPAAGGCDGAIALCDRPLNEVALPATHNSMSVPLPGWYFSEQDAPIAQQLHDGIRGLLIDTHYADALGGGRLRTDLGPVGKLREQAARDGVSPTAVDAALRLRGRLGFSGNGKRGLYLCHSFCELGGTALSSVLRDLHDFLVANPDEVVVVINQDYVTPKDFVDAVDAAGLGELAYRGPTGRRWLTLRQMINRNQRVVFLAENRAGAAPWYHLAYGTITQETPYAFSKPAQLTDPRQVTRSCRPNRGPAGAPLFLVNHWVTTDPVPLPTNAKKVNAYAPLLARLRACERIRHRIPNLVAVNFYRRGDLFRAVDALNGLRP